MRHRVSKKSLNRDTKARRATILGVTIAVLEHGEIVTTKPKGRQAQRLLDSVIVRAQRGDLAARRHLHRIFGRRDVVNNLCERVAPVLAGRHSGFTRLVYIGNRRGDNTPLYRLSLVEVLPPPPRQAAETKTADNQPKKATTKTSQGHAHDEQAKAAVKADQKQAAAAPKLTATTKRRTGGRTSVTGGGRGK